MKLLLSAWKGGRALKDIEGKDGGRDGHIGVLLGKRNPKEVQKGYEKTEIQSFGDALNEVRFGGQGFMGLSSLYLPQDPH